MNDVRIIPLYKGSDQIGHCVVLNIRIFQDGSMSGSVARTYKGESDQSYYLCEGWLEGYSARDRQ